MFGRRAGSSGWDPRWPSFGVQANHRFTHRDHVRAAEAKVRVAATCSTSTSSATSRTCTRRRRSITPGTGTALELSVIIEGIWTAYRNKVLSYLRQLAIVTPVRAVPLRARLDVGQTRCGNVDAMFRRRTLVMPSPPLTTKHHPSAANEDQLLVKTLLSQTKEKTLVNFLHKEFTSIGKEHATQGSSPSSGRGSNPPRPRETSRRRRPRACSSCFRVRALRGPERGLLVPAGSTTCGSGS